LSIIIRSSPRFTTLSYRIVVPSGETLGPQKMELYTRSVNVATARSWPVAGSMSRMSVGFWLPNPSAAVDGDATERAHHG